MQQCYVHTECITINDYQHTVCQSGMRAHSHESRKEANMVNRKVDRRKLL